MLKRKISFKPIKGRSLKAIARFSVWQLILFVAIFASVGGYIIYRSFAATGPVIIANDGPDYNDSQVLGPDGFARVSYTNTSGSLVFIRCLDTQCSSQNTATVDAQGGSNHTSIAVGSDGNVRISYVYNHTLKFAHCTDIDCNSSVITTVTSSPVSTSLGVSSGSMKLGSDGNARIIYTTQISPYGNGLKFIHCTNIDCSTSNASTVVTPGASGTGAPYSVASITPSLSLDSQDYGSFSYFESDYSQSPDWIGYIHCSNLDCSTYSSQHVWTDGGPASTTVTQSISNAKGPFGSGEYNQVPDTRYFVVLGSGPVSVHFDYVYRESLCANSLQVFKVDDTNGSINGVLPGASTWPAAVSSRNPQLVFNEGTSSIGAGTDLTFQGGDILAFRFDGCGNYYYSFDQADSDLKAHMLTYQSTAGQPWQQDWEDGGDFDYNDMVVNITGVQGGTVTGVQGGSPLAPPLEAVSSTIGNDGNPDIAFIWERSISSDSYLRFIHCQDPQCSSSTYSAVDYNDAGSLDPYHNGLSIAVGSDNFARLAFAGSFNGASALKFIRCTSIDCSTKIGPIVPAGTNTGHYSSMAIGSVAGISDLPRLSYLNMGTGSLEFAGCGDINCNTITLPVPPPTAPTNLTATAASNSAINLNWTAATSSIGIASYDIYELGSDADPVDAATDQTNQLVGTTTNTSYQVTGLQDDTGYGFLVIAKDTAGTASHPSNEADATTAGAATSCVSSPKNRCPAGTTWPYLSPFGGQGRPLTNIVSWRIDQGVDYEGLGAVYAMGNGVIKTISTTSKWPTGNYIAYQLSNGPAKGLRIYVAEACHPNPNLSVGKKVTASTVLCTRYTFTDPTGTKRWGIETGWADQSGNTIAVAYYCYSEGSWTPFGVSFSEFMKKSGGPQGYKTTSQSCESAPNQYPQYFKPASSSGWYF